MYFMIQSIMAEDFINQNSDKNSTQRILRLLSWNIGGVKYNTHFLRQVLKSCDICCIQEHWLYPDSHLFLDSIDPSFNTWAISSFDLAPGCVYGRGKGGLAFFWRKDLNVSFEILEDMSSDRIAILRVTPRASQSFYILNVYLPSSSESTSSYRTQTERLENILYELNVKENVIVIMGDFNAHIGDIGGPRCLRNINAKGIILKQLIGTFELQSVNSQVECTGPIETFYSNNGLTKTTVDHIFVTKKHMSSFICPAVLEECSYNLSFHLPICCKIQINVVKKCASTRIKRFVWKKLENIHYLEKYQNKVVALFENMSKKFETEVSEVELEEMVDDIVAKLKLAANSVVPQTRARPHLKKYWNESLTVLNRNVKQLWNRWKKAGKPRGNEHSSFVSYKKAKQEFRKAQRQAVYKEEAIYFESLQKEYDVDHSIFLRKVSRTCKGKKTTNDYILVDGKRVEDDDELLDVWKQYYQELYTPRDDPSFDNIFQKYIKGKLIEYSQSSFQHDDILDRPFETDEIAAVCSNLPNGKASGLDMLTYEHIKYGGSVLYQILTLLFNAVREKEYIVNNWLVGSITSLFKNGKKDKHDMGNYRGITLLNVMGKIFERIVLNRWIPKFEEYGVPNKCQFAYQKDKSSVLSSFVLQEIVHHNVEKGSKVYACFLDSSKAFDMVWLDGLFYKLFNIGMKGKTWRILRRWYQGMKCCVSLNGKLSLTFPVMQGVRQGGVLSPWLFLCFNNDIPSVLQNTTYGLNVNNVFCNSVLVADDVTLLSLRVAGLQCMIDAIYQYSNKWRFLFNPEKTVIVTFGESTQMNNNRKNTRTWYLKDVEIKEKTSWDHVGITLSGNFCSKERSINAASKGKAIIGSLMSAGVRPGGLNPICAASLWKLLGIPAMLYGCEVWYDLKIEEQDVLNRVTAFIAKRAQGLAITTHNAGARGTFGIWKTTAFIDKAKLTFFGSLCRSSPQYLHKQIFIQRLYTYYRNSPQNSLGYIPDIINTLKRYNLYSYLELYLLDGTFPSKENWKKIFLEEINIQQTRLWKEEMLVKPNLQHLNATHRELKPHVHWEVAKRNPDSWMPLANLVNVLCGNIPASLVNAAVDDTDYYICKLCQKRFSDFGHHFVMDCSAVCNERNDMWDKLMDELPITIISQLHSMECHDTFNVLVSGDLPTIKNNIHLLDKFLILVSQSLINIFYQVQLLTINL